MRFWLLAGCSVGETLCEAGWRQRLGDLYSAMRCYLEDAGTAAVSYPSPYRGERDYALRRISEESFRIDPYSGGRCGEEDAESFTEAELALFERDFSAEETAGMRLAVERMLRDAGEALGVTPDVADCGGGFYRLGVRARRIVFAYLGSGETAAEALTAHLAAAGSNCDLYVAQRTAAAATFGVLAGREIVELGEHLDIDAQGAFRCVGRNVCKHADAAGLKAGADGGVDGEVARPAVYEVGGRFRVEEGCSRVVTVKGGAVWNVPSFTRYVLLVLLTDPREGGLTSEMLHAAAKKLYLSECLEVLDAGKGKGSSIVGVRPLRQYFRITGKNDRKTTHPFFGQITANPTKTPSYYIKKEAVKVRRASD